MGEPREIFVERDAEKNAHRFIIYFLYDDEDQSVYVEEVEEIDLLKVVQHLSFGGSIFIANRREAARIEEVIMTAVTASFISEEDSCGQVI